MKELHLQAQVEPVHLQAVQLQPVHLQAVQLQPVQLQPVQLKPVQLKPVQLDQVQQQVLVLNQMLELLQVIKSHHIVSKHFLQHSLALIVMTHPLDNRLQGHLHLIVQLAHHLHFQQINQLNH